MNVDNPPYTITNILLFFVFLLQNIIPAINPIIPKENICQGVHGPCLNIKLDTKPDNAPVKNPASPPNAIPAIITTNYSNEFFSGNSFYTTSANRMSRQIFKNAIISQEVIDLCKKN